MASTSKTAIIDKLSDQHELIVMVNLSKKFKVRLWIACQLAYLMGLILGTCVKFEREDPDGE
jgi:hypothetical protein